MFERLYNLFLHFREYVFLSGLVVLSLIFLSLNDAPQIKRLRTIAIVTLGMIQDQVSFVPRYFRLATENELLRRTNIELADQVNQLREARLENMRLRRLLELKQASAYEFVAASIVSKDLTLLRNTLTLNVGEADGVRPSMPVVHDAGLVGVVVAASQHYSVVNILLNTDFRASAKVQRSRVDGILAWNGTSLTLNNIAKTLDVQPGDVIVTSEYSSTYPANLRIGLVSEVTEQPGSLFKEVTVIPGVDFVKLEEVFVMSAIPDQEKTYLERQAGEWFSR